MWAYADTVGVALDWKSKLIVTSACRSSRSQRSLGKSSETPAMMLMKCALKFRMSTSAALRLWAPGGTSSSYILYYYLMRIFIISDT